MEKLVFYDYERDFYFSYVNHIELSESIYHTNKTREGP